MILDIHLEGCDDSGEEFRKIVEIGKPFNISVVPVLFLSNHEVFRNGVYPFDYYYPQKFVDILKEFAKNPNVTFGQQGFTHYCLHCYEIFIKRGGREKGAWPDPWHENKCLYGKIKSVDEQAEIMQRGKKVIENILEVSPRVYVAPNHQGDKNTKKAAEELDYRHLAIKNLLKLSPYREGNLIILPEGDIGNGEIVYTHYDQMSEDFNKYLDVVRDSKSLDDLKISKNPKFKAKLNDSLINGRKRVRDLIKILSR